ncbi:MAG: RNA polymerase subunit sigma-70 [Betaproteobacteria bacterium]|nr:MAG: RNA polymerase subunit sigma-70 [Betaproteobacteria bacterium]
MIAPVGSIPAGVELARKVKRLSRLELPGAGQVTVDGNYAYIGHITNKEHLGTSILDVSDPRQPKLLSQLTVDEPDSHSHKARVAGDLMIVNVEQNLGKAGRQGVDGSAEQTSYAHGGFKLYDISDRRRPKLIKHQRTWGRGVHRFDMDSRYAYISTEMEGYVGNILVIYDIRDPARPQEVSRWWMAGQHVAGGEKPTWIGRRNRLHHALRFGDELWAGCWHAGLRVIDIADIRKPRTLGEYNYHPPFPEPTHTFMPVPQRINGRRIAVAIDEEDHAHSAEELERRRGRPHGCLWVFDVTDVAAMKPLAIYEVSELDSPWSRATPARFGAHQFQEHMEGTLVYCAWFSGGLRIVDVADPTAPREVGWFIPEPAAGKPAPQTNDVDVDKRGLVYIVDRYTGFDILEFNSG